MILQIIALVVSFLAQPARLAPNKKPNILFIVSDDQSRNVGHLGPLNNLEKWAQPTPNLDKLAKEGVTFTSAHVCAPECNPSRTCFIFGESPLDTKVVANGDNAGNAANLAKESLPAYMQRNGYTTSNYQRLFHLGSELGYKFDHEQFFGGEGDYAHRLGNDRLADHRLTDNFDFGTIFKPKEQAPDWMAVQAMLADMKANKAAGKTGFYAMGFSICHTPIYVPAEVMAKIDFTPAKPPVPPNDFDDIPTKGKYFGAAFKPNADLALANHPILTSYLRHYYGCIQFSDLMLGELMKYVDSQPEDEWMVVFTSDHGFHLVDKERMSKFTLWRAVTQVPLVIRGGPFTGGKVVDTPVSLVDLFKTFSVMFGEGTDHPLDGYDLVKIANGGKRPPVVVYHKWGKAVINKKWHLITYQNWNGATYGPQDQTQFELYKTNDPWNLMNLAKSRPKIVNNLKGKQL